MEKSVTLPINLLRNKALLIPEFTILAAICAAKDKGLTELELASFISDTLYDVMSRNGVFIETDSVDRSLMFHEK